MAKKKIAKNNNTKKNVDKKIDNIKMNTSNEAYKILTILFGVMVFLALFYLITVFIVGRDIKEEKVEANIQYEEILAGSSFTMRDDEYVVVYYDFNNEAMSGLYSALTDYSTTGSKRLYTVDMSNGFNKKYVGMKANKKPKDASELIIADATLIEFKDGKVVKYVEGSQEVIDSLK